MIKLGFTGTRHGMTTIQRWRVSELLHSILPDEVHHGDCIGADAEFHNLVKVIDERLARITRVIGHPPNDDKHRAFCEVDIEREPQPYLNRNHAIVQETQTLIAAPATPTEQIRSGTWTTVRAARKSGREIFLVHYDGTVKREAPRKKVTRGNG